AFVDDLRPAAQISLRRSSSLVTTGPDNLHAFSPRCRGAEKHLLRRKLPLLVSAAAGERVAGLVEEYHTTRRAQRDVRVVLDPAPVERVTGDGGHDFGFLAREVATEIEAVNAEIDERS